MSEESIDIVDSLVAAGDGPCWEGYVQVGTKMKDGRKVPNCVPKNSASAQEFSNKRTISQTPAPKKDQRTGSTKNAKGSASSSGKARKVTFSAATEKSLKEKVAKHNEKAPDGRKATLGMLKAVYRRGAGAFSVSHRPGMTRNGWAMARVNAYLKLLKSGKPSNAAYKSDNDLLPASHPRSTKKSASITASGLVPEERDLAEALIAITQKHGPFDQDGDGVWAGYTPAAENEVKDIGVKCSNCVFFQGPNACTIISLEVEADGKCRFAVIPEGVVSVKPEYKELEDEIENYMLEKELTVDIKHKEDYEYAEDAILAMTEYSGFGYEAEPAIRASWLRGVRNGEDPFLRASLLASLGYESLDADLLPVIEEDNEQNPSSKLRH